LGSDRHPKPGLTRSRDTKEIMGSLGGADEVESEFYNVNCLLFKVPESFYEPVSCVPSVGLLFFLF
jgi:hypothetical protein